MADIWLQIFCILIAPGNTGNVLYFTIEIYIDFFFFFTPPTGLLRVLAKYLNQVFLSVYKYIKANSKLCLYRSVGTGLSLL